MRRPARDGRHGREDRSPVVRLCSGKRWARVVDLRLWLLYSLLYLTGYEAIWYPPRLPVGVALTAANEAAYLPALRDTLAEALGD